MKLADDDGLPPSAAAPHLNLVPENGLASQHEDMDAASNPSTHPVPVPVPVVGDSAYAPVISEKFPMLTQFRVALPIPNPSGLEGIDCEGIKSGSIPPIQVGWSELRGIKSGSIPFDPLQSSWIEDETATR